jgi:hypothetical protein
MSKTTLSPKASVVYFIRCAADPLLYKIGVTTSVDSRLRTIKTSCPFDIVLSHYLPGTAQDERRLHRLLADERQCGEWFCGENTHYLAWSTLENESLDENVVVPWLTDEIAAIRQYRSRCIVNAIGTEGVVH